MRKINILLIIVLIFLMNIKCSVFLGEGDIPNSLDVRDLNINSNLIDYLKNTQENSIVIRDISGLNLSKDTLNRVEKELFKGGFLVKDRSLMKEILSESDDIDYHYQMIGELIGADLVFEITNLSNEGPTSYRYSYFYYSFPSILMGKIVIVETGDAGAFFEIKIYPEPSDPKSYEERIRDVNSKYYEEYYNDYLRFFKDDYFVEVLMAELIKKIKKYYN